MAEIIDAWWAWTTSRGEDKNKHDYDQPSTPDLTFKEWAQQVESFPVYDDVTDNDSDNTIEGCWGSSFHASGVYKRAKYIACDPWNKINDESFDDSKTVLNSRKEHEGNNDIAKDVHEVYVHKNGRQKSIELFFVRKFNVLVVPTMVDKGLSFDLK